MSYFMFLDESYQRGFLFQCTDLEGLKELLQKQKIITYLGFDATAPSLHVGNLVGIMWLRLLKKHGHTPIVLIGDATTKIGDPSGKDEQRKMLPHDEIENNIQTITKAFHRFLGENIKIVRNEDWLGNIGYLEFLKRHGSHFTINRMMTFDSVRMRLEREQPLTFLEFNYMLLQAYDFLELFRCENCLLQMGGSDQWGNIVNGVELIRRTTGKTAYGITAPLIKTASGAKMGKSAKGAIWLNADMLSPYDYWQFWRNTHDDDVLRYMKLFTDIDLEEIDRYQSVTGAALNALKCTLADEATKLAHGEEVLDDIHTQVRQFFGDGGGQKQASTIEDLPIRLDKLLINLKMVKSKGEFKGMTYGKAVKINDVVNLDTDLTITKAMFQNGYLKLSVGKKRHHMLKL
jgi:tyrosyl-tRNA synthetase